MALKYEEALQDRAKANLKTHTKEGYGLNQPILNSGEAVNPIRVDKEIAKIANVGHDTIYKAKVIQQKAPEEVKQQLRTGETTINKVYQNIKREEEAVKTQETLIKKAAAFDAKEPDERLFLHEENFSEYREAIGAKIAICEYDAGLIELYARNIYRLTTGVFALITNPADLEDASKMDGKIHTKLEHTLRVKEEGLYARDYMRAEKCPRTQKEFKLWNAR